MKTGEVIDALSALAHEYRLAIYRLLIARGPEGLPAGVIGERVGLQPSSLTFHLQALQRAGLVAQLRVSRQLIYSADFSVMNELVEFLTDKCCSQGSGSGAGDCCPASECKPLKRSKSVRRAKAA